MPPYGRVFCGCCLCPITILAAGSDASPMTVPWLSLPACTLLMAASLITKITTHSLMFFLYHPPRFTLSVFSSPSILPSSLHPPSSPPPSILHPPLLPPRQETQDSLKRELGVQSDAELEELVSAIPGEPASTHQG